MFAIIFTSNYAALGFAIAIVCFFVCEQIGGVIIPALRRHGARVQRRNFGSNMLVIFSWVAVMGFSAVFAKMGTWFLPNWIYFVGIVAMAAGIVFRQWAIAVLGRYFSGVIGVQQEHKVVDWGPYRLIRHPSYTGVLIFLVGMGLAVQSLAATFVNATIFAIAYGYRIYVEEKVLKTELGNSYAEYMKRTKRVIPHLI